jgi:hypothetical protein
MSMRDDTRPRVDDHIDDVARSLTGGSPSPMLRAAIHARIASGPNGPTMRPWYLGAAAAAAALILIAMLWPNRESVERVSTPGGEMSGTVAEQRGGPTAPEANVPVWRTLSGSPGGPDEARTTFVGVVAGASEIPEPPLEVELLDVMPLELEPLEVPMIVVEGLSIDPLVVQ